MQQQNNDNKLLEEHEENEEEENIDEKIIYVNNATLDDISVFTNQSNEFWNHIINVNELKQQSFSLLSKENNINIFSTSQQLNLEKYLLIDLIKNKLTYTFTKMTRKVFNCDDELFEKVILQSILSRRSVLVTSKSFQHRMQLRECACAAIVSYLIEKFGHIAQYNELKLQQEMKEARENVVASGQIMLNEQEDFELSVSENDNIHFNGFARPQVLILTSTKHHAWRILTILLSMFPNLEQKNIGRFHKFERRFAPDDSILQYQIQKKSYLPDEIPDKIAPAVGSQKDLEWVQHYLGDNDNDFSVTLSVHKRGPHAVMLDADYKKADLILISPTAALRMESEHLSSLHTVFIDSIDYLLDQDLLLLKQLLQKLHQRPKLIKETNINTLSDNYIYNIQQSTCQYILFQAQECEFTNGIFNEDAKSTSKEDYDKGYENASKEAVKNEIFVNANALGLIKIKVPEREFKKFHFTAISMNYQLNLSERRTDILPYNSLKFSLTEHPKIDYMVNKLLDDKVQGTVIYCQNTFQYIRLKSLLKKIRMSISSLTEEMEKEEYFDNFKQFKQNEVEILIVTESLMYRKRAKILSKYLIFTGPPLYKEVFEELCQNCSGQICLLHDGQDGVRLSNIFSEDVANQIQKVRVYQI